MAARPLSEAQEARVISYLDEKLLELSRAFETRKASRARLPSLSSYLSEIHSLFAFVLKIPPVAPSTEIRTAYALSLTAAVPEALSGYFVDDEAVLASFLKTLDRYWTLVLRNQPYSSDNSGAQDARAPTSPVASIRMTDRVRLESIIYEIRSTLASVLSGPKIVALRVNPFQDESAFLHPSLLLSSTNKEPSTDRVRSRSETPALTNDAESSAMSVDESTATVEEDDEDEDDDGAFDEVAIADDTGERELDIHFRGTLAPDDPMEAAPAQPPTATARGFDPDEEYPADDDENEDNIEVSQVFKQTIEILDQLKT